MAPIMPRDEHEKLLEELLKEDLEHNRKTEILTQLRTDHSTAHVEFGEVNKNVETLKQKHANLVESNSQLFRQLGAFTLPREQQQEQQQQQAEKEFSETITISQLEGRV